MHLNVGDGHRLYYEIHGRSDGPTAVVLHGGPGGGMQRSHLKFFDLTKWRVLLFDQRGCGRSTPFLSLHKNTTWDLVEDIEKLRCMMDLDKWTVFGGSWGSTLALAYCSRHQDHVAALVLRGVYLAEKWENDWLTTETGAARLFPDRWVRLTRLAKGKTGTAMTKDYIRMMRSKNRSTRKAAAAAWYAWESAISTLRPERDTTSARVGEAISVLECHYFSHRCWIPSGSLIKAAKRIPKRIPVYIVQGRYDLVCPPASAYAIHQAVPHSKLKMTIAGHAGSEPETAAALLAATNALAR